MAWFAAPLSRRLPLFPDMLKALMQKSLHLRHMSPSSQPGVLLAQAAVEILGKRKGEQMAMLVHHSRNSVQKQWEETLVLALSGMARILRAHLPVLVNMPGFSQVISSASLRCQDCLIPCRHPYNAPTAVQKDHK